MPADASRTSDAASPPGARPAAAPSRATRILLACGVVAGPLFVLLILAQAMTRDGFDPRRHPLSLLSLGEQGWIQTVNFLVSGLLVVASARGAARVLSPGSAGRTWGPALLGVYGAALVWAGVFRTDPADGFPPGAPAGPADAGWHGLLHNIAPVGMGVALSAACLVFARRFARDGRRGWAAYSAVAAVAYYVLGFAAFPAQDFRLMLAGGAVIWTWAAALSLRLLVDARAADRDQPRPPAAGPGTEMP
ncbi:DUF998 domain-containing protein [Pseudonocardia humida]|uniref:DUF998 domain-containing protein n=1 Tax=Pseudonocardia humida TaxID=2800819 RepID=A0ABT1A2R9_9PSEU|nr:DUF998 domain-containing protein [Pseudonocardia humida]MCO1657282.1 DUF998 domain-containing protein [Pseudonocardia humida]